MQHEIYGKLIFPWENIYQLLWEKCHLYKNIYQLAWGTVLFLNFKIGRFPIFSKKNVLQTNFFGTPCKHFISRNWCKAQYLLKKRDPIQIGSLLCPPEGLEFTPFLWQNQTIPVSHSPPGVISPWYTNVTDNLKNCSFANSLDHGIRRTYRPKIINS